MALPVVRGERLILRPLDEPDLDRLADILAAPGVAEWWSPPAPAAATREELRRDGSAFGIEVDGDLVGWLGVHDETDEDWRATGLDVFLAPSHQGRGLGPEALRTVIRWLAEERGCSRFPSTRRWTTSAPSRPTAPSASGPSVSCARSSAAPTGAGATTC